jgi:hypothetical protein
MMLDNKCPASYPAILQDLYQSLRIIYKIDAFYKYGNTQSNPEGIYPSGMMKIYKLSESVKLLYSIHKALFI